ncbi:hypothetical protein MCUN1_001289 [Malassezia cuniculi]|uniref:Cwf19-like C-terminal domain-containing protein n=1 Tax=Malassezia cuniculi TaxID=948313 RepID=A0AAF0EXI8_9BASI|nr:hypothetical protein MCUN1_001289 [Malassezia cuniculi]
MSSHKVLILGPCEGHIDSLVDKVTAINSKHGPFSALFVVGNLFGDGSSDAEKQLLDGSLACACVADLCHSAHTFSSALVAVRVGTPDGPTVEIAQNLFYIGSAGIIDIDGFRVAFCGGDRALYRGASHGSKAATQIWTPIDSQEAAGDALHMLESHPDMALGDASAKINEPTSLAEARAQVARKEEIEAMMARDAEVIRSRKPIDFLLTTFWPQGVDTFTSVALPEGAHAWGSVASARLAERARPRYHFSISPDTQLGAFWEREPYENPPFTCVVAPPSITRFVSLARVANPSKLRWFMALSLIPARELDPQRHPAAFTRPSNLTPSPVLVQVKRGAPAAESENNVRFGAPEKRQRPARRRREAAPVNPEQCWFCLSNPRIEKYLIVAIGEECYVAFPKGQLPVSTDASTPVPGGGHVLIIATGPTAPALRNEMRRWKEALAACYAAYDAVPVAWEAVKRVGTRASHCQTQVVPVPKGRIPGLVEYFTQAAEDDGLKFESDDVAAAFDACNTAMDESVGLVPEDRDEFFRVEIDGRVLLALPRGQRFNLQLGRETLAAYLSMPDRGDWRACTRPPEAEAAEVEEFKAVFDAYAAKVAE